ncbi:MAG: NUDIX domain-containing protein [Bacteriovoracaceae bacterium]|nr:NUDIX domain-containing protein [Bacteriovoracaceae bacterium]
MERLLKAVSLVLQRDSKYFVVVRKNSLLQWPGYTSFPGGKIASGESDHEALKREAFEELEIDLDDSCLFGPPQKVTCLLSPKFFPIRVENTLYRVEVKKDIELDVTKISREHNEHSEGKWMLPSEVLNEYHQGLRLMVYPMKRFFEGADLPDTITPTWATGTLPTLEFLGGIFQIIVPSYSIPPAEHTNCFFLGDVLIDPSPKDRDSFDLLVNTVKDLPLKKIFITHHHPDHHQHAPDLARKLGIPIFISQDSHSRALSKKGDHYFEGVEIVLSKDGDILTVWNDKDVIVMSTPGHDRGQLGLYPRQAGVAQTPEWFIVGDLIQGIGTVVIGGEEGNMKSYMTSLEKVMELSPQFIFPSHGFPTGGINRIKTVYNHRIMREGQIKRLHDTGHDSDQIYDEIYPSLDRRLKVLAMENIKKHLEKLKEEGKI